MVAKLRQRVELLRGELQRVVGLRKQAEALRDRLQLGEDLSSEGTQMRGGDGEDRVHDEQAENGRDGTSGSSGSSGAGSRGQDAVTLDMTDLDGCVER